MAAFSSIYLLFSHQAIGFESEVFKLAIAGSLANVVSDSCFHFIDVININKKAVDLKVIQI
jgi:hypothetical protein